MEGAEGGGGEAWLGGGAIGVMYGALHFADLLEQIYRCKLCLCWGGGGGARGARGKRPRGAGREGEIANADGRTGMQAGGQTDRQTENGMVGLG